MSKQMEPLHLGREAKTALELAIVALAPPELVDRLALVAGLLDAIAELDLDHTTALPIVPKAIERATRALADWRLWQAEHLPKGSA